MDDYIIYVRKAKTGGYIAKLVRQVGEREIVHKISAAYTIDEVLRILNFEGDAPVYFEENKIDSQWVCAECFRKIAQESECFSDSNFTKKKCYYCYHNIGVYHVVRPPAEINDNEPLRAA